MAIKNKYVLEFNSKGVKKTKQDIDKLDKSQGALAKNATKLKAGMAISGAAIVAAGGYAIKTAAEFQTLQTRLNTMYGSVTRGTKAFKTFVKVASTTPFAVKGVVAAGASLKAFGMDAEKNIKGVADLAAFMGTDVVEAANAMGRAFAGGAGAADVLRERGVLELIKSFKGIEDITKLTLPEFRTALIDAMQDPQMGISGATTALSETFEGNMSNMLDAVDRLAAKMGDALIPAAQNVVQGLTGFINSLISSKDAVNENISSMIGEQTQLNMMVNTITHANTSQQMRVKLIRDLQKEYPDFLKNINAEKVTNEQLKTALLNANMTYEKRIQLITLEAEASLIRAQMASLQADQVTETQEYSDAIMTVAGELNHFVDIMNQFNEGDINWAGYFGAIDDVVGNVVIASGEGRDKIEKHFSDMFEGASVKKMGESVDFGEVTGLNEEAIRKFVETSDLFENWRGADIWDDKMQDIIASSLKWDSVTQKVTLDFKELGKAFAEQDIGSNKYLQMFPQLNEALLKIMGRMNAVNETITKEPKVGVTGAIEEVVSAVDVLPDINYTDAAMKDAVDRLRSQLVYQLEGMTDKLEDAELGLKLAQTDKDKAKIQADIDQYLANIKTLKSNVDMLPIKPDVDVIDETVIEQVRAFMKTVEDTKKLLTEDGGLSLFGQGGEDEGEPDKDTKKLIPGLDTSGMKDQVIAGLAETKAAWLEGMIALQEELVELNLLDVLTGGTDEVREEKKAMIVAQIEEITDAITTVEETTKDVANGSLKFFGKIAKAFGKFVTQVAKDENNIQQEVLDGASALISAGGMGKEKQIKMQKAMIKANTAKGLIDVWTNPTPNAPLTAAKAIAASAVLIGKASQSNQQLNQALADLKGDGGGTTSATFAEYGMNEVVDGATPIIAGEAGAELVQITPLEGPNTQGPQGQGQIIITGNVMSKDFVEDELVEQLKESIRQGYDFR